jgi:PrtD family type I secretion system ABC transporter
MIQRHTQSLLRHANAIAGMGMGAAAVQAWRARHEALLESRSGLAERSARLAAGARIARQALQAAVLGIGAWLVVGENASPGIMIGATILLSRALQPVEQLISGWKTFVETRAAWQRIERPGSVPAMQELLALPAPQGRVDVERVVFATAVQGATLIKGATFSLQAGESLGLVGPSGAGKTTLLRLMLGIWKPQSGVVRLDGANIAQWDRDALGLHVGYLPQDAELFAGTVAENIARLGPVDDGRVVEAARLAHAHEMILRLPQGYDTPVGERGVTLSGGQRQRIAIARAILRDAPLLLLDEATSALDAESETLVQTALEELMRHRTTLVIPPPTARAGGVGSRPRGSPVADG